MSIVLWAATVGIVLMLIMILLWVVVGILLMMTVPWMLVMWTVSMPTVPWVVIEMGLMLIYLCAIVMVGSVSLIAPWVIVVKIFSALMSTFL